MSKGLQNLREQRAAKAKELQDLVAKDEWNPEVDQPVYDAGMKAIESIDAQIENHVKLNEAAVQDRVEENVLAAAERNAKDAPSEGAALFAKWVKGGDRALSAEDWNKIRNTMSTTTGSEGGYTVPTEVASSVLDALKAFGGMRSLATVIRTDGGAGMTWPTSDGTAEEGEIVAENASATDEDVSFGELALPVYKYSSKVVPVPIELLQDSNVDIEAFVRGRLVTRLGRITNKHYVTGTGTNQPQGFVPAVTVGRTTAGGQVDTLIYDDFVYLEHSVDPAYRRAAECAFAMHDDAMRGVKLIKDTEGRPIFIPGYDPATMNQADRVLNYRVEILQEMDAPAANAKSVAFGDFSKYVIRDAMDLVMHRFDDSAYAKKGQIGFLAFLRSGGNYMDVGGAVKVLQHAAA